MKFQRIYDFARAEGIKLKKKSRLRKERRCLDCGADISLRHGSAKRCIDCACDRMQSLRKQRGC